MLVPTLDRVVSTTTHEWAVDAVITNGMATAARSPVGKNSSPMPVLYVSDNNPSAHARPNRRQLVSGKDTKGKVHDFVFVTGAAGPAKTLIHIGPDRQIAEAFSFEWKKVNGGWLATAFTATVFKQGRVLAQIRSTNKAFTPPAADATTKNVAPGGQIALDEQDACIFKADEPCDGSLVLGGGEGAGDTGCCANERIEYLNAATQAAAATQLALYAAEAAPLAPPVAAVAALALTAALAYAAFKLRQYNDCVNNGCKPVADSGGSAPSGAPFSRLLDYPAMYFRPA
jgi:hypothetical protein